MSRRARIWCAPPGPVQSPGSTIRSSTRTPSEVVVPTCRPATQQDVGDEPGHRALAVRPRDRHDRDPPVGVADPRRRRRPGGGDPLGPARERGAPGRRSAGRSATATRRARPARGGLGEGQRALRAGPREGDDPVAGVRRAMDGAARRGPRRGRRAAGGPRPTIAATPSGQSRAGTSRPRWTSAWRPGSRWPYQVRRRPMATSSLTTGSSR